MDGLYSKNLILKQQVVRALHPGQNIFTHPTAAPNPKRNQHWMPMPFSYNKRPRSTSINSALPEGCSVSTPCGVRDASSMSPSGLLEFVFGPSSAVAKGCNPNAKKTIKELLDDTLFICQGTLAVRVGRVAYPIRYKVHKALLPIASTPASAAFDPKAALTVHATWGIKDATGTINTELHMGREPVNKPSGSVGHALENLHKSLFRAQYDVRHGVAWSPSNGRPEDLCGCLVFTQATKTEVHDAKKNKTVNKMVHRVVCMLQLDSLPSMDPENPLTVRSTFVECLLKKQVINLDDIGFCLMMARRLPFEHASNFSSVSLVCLPATEPLRELLMKIATASVGAYGIYGCNESIRRAQRDAVGNIIYEACVAACEDVKTEESREWLKDNVFTKKMNHGINFALEH